MWMNRVKSLGSVVAVGLVMALVGACGSSADDEDARQPDPDPAPSEEAVADPVDVPPAEVALRRAIRRLVQDDTGSFTTDLELPAGEGMKVAGVYSLDSETSRQTVDIESPQGPLAFEVVSGAEGAWLRFVKAGSIEDARCWMHADGALLDQAQGFQAPVGFTRGVPAAVLAPFHARGVSWTEPGTVLRSTTDLSVLASAVGTLAEGLGIDPTSTDQVELDVLLEGGRIAGWEATMGDLFDAAEQSGLVVPEDIGRDDPLVRDLVIVASISEPGRPVSVEPPHPRKVVDLVDERSAEDGSFDAEYGACEARWATP